MHSISLFYWRTIDTEWWTYRKTNYKQIIMESGI